MSIVTNDIRDKNGNIVRTAALNYDPKRAKTFNLNPSTIPDSVRYLVQDPRDARPLRVSVPTVDSTMAKKFKIEEAIADRRFEQELNLLNADTANLLDDKSITIFKAAAKEMADKNVPLKDRIPSRDRLDTFYIKISLKTVLNYCLRIFINMLCLTKILSEIQECFMFIFLRKITSSWKACSFLWRHLLDYFWC